MRIKRLELKAFGPFSDRTLDFSSQLPGLHVVHGPNEAGKSSSLRALQALFFGFPARTGDNFLHSYDQLLVGGRLQGSDGGELTFYRRKRTKNSLFDDHDNPLDPAVLAPFLHGLEQDLFSTLYGIDHETLARGGQGILDQHGEVGQALFAAGTGLASLKTVLDDLENEAGGLFRPRGSSQAISAALTRYRELQARIKQATLSGREWQEHQRALEDAGARLASATERRDGLNRERNHLERLKQSLPFLGQRAILLEKLAALGQVIELPADFGERRAQLEQREREIRIRLESARNRLTELREKRDGVRVNQRLLDRGAEIEELQQSLGQHRKARSDRPQLNGLRIGCRSEAAALLKLIRPDSSIDQVEELRPALLKRTTIQALAARHEALLQGVDAPKRQAQSIARDLERTLGVLKNLPPAIEAGRLSRTVAQAQKAGDLDGEIATLRRALAGARKGYLATRERLGLWSGEPDSADVLPVPLPETLSRYDEQFRALDDGMREEQKERTQLDEELGRLTEQLREIEYAAEVPAEEDLARQRDRREHGWQLLRRQWLRGEDIDTESRDYDPERPLPEAFERMVAVSDQTADRLYREADRVQKHASLKARAKGIGQRLAELAEKAAGTASALSAAEAGWTELWAPCAITPLSPREMQAWLTGFDKLRFQVEEAGKIATSLTEREERRRKLRQALLDELAAAGEHVDAGDEGLSPVLETASALELRARTAQSRRETLEARSGELRTALHTAQADRENSEEELKRWRSLWADAMAPLGIAETTPPAEAIDFIESLQICFAKLKEANDFRKRIDGIDRDGRDFEETVSRLTTDIAPDLAGQDALQAVAQLKARLVQASRDQARAQQYIEESSDLEKSSAKAHTELTVIGDQMAALRTLAGCESGDGLDQAEQRSTEYVKLREKLEEIEVSLGRICEGIPLADLEEQAREINPDDIPGRIRTLADEIEGRLDPEIRQLSEIIGREKNELTRMDGGGRAAELADESQQELAVIRRLTEHYIRLRLAAKVLREEIERYRLENQGPVLTIASRYFSHLTLGSFSGLRTDIDDQEQPVLIGVRPNGAWVHVEGMSSGTRDQLYLALRLATLEWRIGSGEPMPFIVDDILINFDDQRSKATLESLSGLAEKTQVILFTHHDRVVEAAQALNQPDRVFVHRL